MRELVEGAKTLAVLLIAGAIFAVAFKFGMSSYTEYLEKNRQADKDLRSEVTAEEHHKEEIRLEEMHTRKAQIDAQLSFTQEQNRQEEIKFKIIHEDLENTKKNIELKAQAEKTAKVGLELEKAVQLTVDKAAALKVTIPTWTFTLKDGTIVKTTRCVEMDKEWVIKNDKGELVSIAKDTIQSVR